MNIIFLSTTFNYPFAFSANNTKTELLARGMKEQGHKVSIVSGILGERNFNEIKKGLTTDDIEYVLLPRRGNYIQTIKTNLKYLNEYLNIKFSYSEKNIIIMDFNQYPIFLIHTILARHNHYKVLSLLTEWPLSFHWSLIKKIDAFIYLNTFGWFVDGILPISESIKNKIRKFKKPILKIPILSDFSHTCNTISQKEKNYFAFCSSARYVRIIAFIIQTYIIFNKEHTEKLFLVLYGSDEDIFKISQIISENKLNEQIIIKSKLSPDDLHALYANALGLLIPLDPNNEQDKYRFSQKMAEYLSSKTPIITTAVGEAALYFKPENCYILNEYTPEAYAKVMSDIASNKVKSQMIGENGYEMGKKEFNYKIFGEKLSNFINNLNQ